MIQRPTRERRPPCRLVTRTLPLAAALLVLLAGTAGEVPLSAEAGEGWWGGLDEGEAVSLTDIMGPVITTQEHPHTPNTAGPYPVPVTMVEFADFQCPYCRRAHPTVSRVLMEYGDKIRYVFMDYPLNNHERAIPAAEAETLTV